MRIDSSGNGAPSTASTANVGMRIYWGDGTSSSASTQTLQGGANIPFNLTKPTPYPSATVIYTATTYLYNINWAGPTATVRTGAIAFQYISGLIDSYFGAGTTGSWYFGRVRQLAFTFCSVSDFSKVIPPPITVLDFDNHASTTISLNFLNQPTGLQQLALTRSASITSINWNLSMYQLKGSSSPSNTDGTGTVGALWTGDWRANYQNLNISQNTSLTSLTLTLPSTVGRVNIGAWQAYAGNSNLSTLTFPSNTHLESTTVSALVLIANKLTSWNYTLPTTCKYFVLASNVTLANYQNNVAGLSTFNLNLDSNNNNLLILGLYQNNMTSFNPGGTAFNTKTNLMSLELSINRLTTYPTLPNNLQLLGVKNNLLTSIPSLPTGIVSFLGGGVSSSGSNLTASIISWSGATQPSNEPSGPHNDFSNIFTSGNSGPTYLTSRTNLRVLKLVTTKLQNFELNCPSSLEILDLSNWLPTGANNNVITIVFFDMFSSAKRVNLSRLTGLTSIRNVHNCTTLEALNLSQVGITNINEFFNPTVGATQYYFPPSIRLLIMDQNNFSTASGTWNRDMFNPTVVNSLQSIIIRDSRMSSISMNYLLDRFNYLCTHNAAGAVVTKPNSVMPNLVEINFSNVISSSAGFNQPPTIGTPPAPNGCSARNSLISNGVNLVLPTNTCP
jgi:hypothetical protein